MAEGIVPLHRRTHPQLDVEGCFGCKATGVGFVGVERLKANRRDGVIQADIKRDIYRNAKRDGVDIKKAGSTSPSSGPLI